MVSKVKVWDLPVRVFHWSLFILFFIAYFTGDEDNLVHIYSGYIICGLIVFRIIWGFVGSRYARFNDFVYSPGAVAGYLKSLLAGKPQHYLGHNPAGGWMVLLLLLSLVLVSWSGLEVYGAEGHGPLAYDATPVISAAYADDHDDENGGMESDSEEFWEELHEVLSNFTLFLVIIHIIGVAVSSHQHRENLPRAMVTGYKEVKRDDE